MNRKFLTLFGILLLCLTAYANWPKKSPNVAFTLCSELASPERQKEVDAMMENLKRCFLEKRFNRIEQLAFALPMEIRLLKKEGFGYDPVETEVKILKDYGSSLDWSHYDTVTYKNASTIFDVTMNSKEEKVKIRFRFIRSEKERRYHLESIETISEQV